MHFPDQISPFLFIHGGSRFISDPIKIWITISGLVAPPFFVLSGMEKISHPVRINIQPSVSHDKGIKIMLVSDLLDQRSEGHRLGRHRDSDLLEPFLNNHPAHGAEGIIVSGRR